MFIQPLNSALKVFIWCLKIGLQISMYHYPVVWSNLWTYPTADTTEQILLQMYALYLKMVCWLGLLGLFFQLTTRQISVGWVVDHWHTTPILNHNGTRLAAEVLVGSVCVYITPEFGLVLHSSWCGWLPSYKKKEQACYTTGTQQAVGCMLTIVTHTIWL